MEKKYDVFISCKSEDYKIAEEVYHFLVDKGFYTFLSSKELRKMKDSEYMDAISEALDSAYHLVVLATSKENITSKWVKFEWSTFLNEQLSGRKQGQIMSILSGMEICDLPIQLRHYEVFTPKDYQEKILSYIETPEYLKRKREAEEKAKLEEEKRKQEKEAKERRDLLIKSIEEDSIDYRIHSSSLESKAMQIIEKQKIVGRKEKKCPVCGTVNAIERSFCKKCSWNFNPVFEDSPQGDKEQLFLAQGLWGHIRTNVKLKDAQDKKIVELEINLKACKEERDNLNDKLSDLQKNINTLEEKLRRESSELEIVKRDLYNARQQYKDVCFQKEENDKIYTSKLKLLEDKYNSALEEVIQLKKELKVHNTSSNEPIRHNADIHKLISTLLEEKNPAENVRFYSNRRFKTKAEVFQYVKANSLYPASLSNSFEIESAINWNKFVEKLKREYGIRIDRRGIDDIKGLVNSIWTKSKEKP